MPSGAWQVSYSCENVHRKWWGLWHHGELTPRKQQWSLATWHHGPWMTRTSISQSSQTFFLSCELLLNTGTQLQAFPGPLVHVHGCELWPVPPPSWAPCSLCG